MIQNVTFKDMIQVGMGDFKVAKYPLCLTTLGLGSCVGLTLFDRVNRVGGMLHAMLPDSRRSSGTVVKAKFVDTGILELLSALEKAGADINHLEAKLAGGAKMFAVNNSNFEVFQVGENNIKASKEWLAKFNIRILAEDTGANYGRTIVLHTDAGEVEIKTVGKQIKVI